MNIQLESVDLNTGLVVPVSSLICCIIAKSIVYILPIADRLTSSSDASYAACTTINYGKSTDDTPVNRGEVNTLSVV